MDVSCEIEGGIVPVSWLCPQSMALREGRVEKGGMVPVRRFSKSIKYSSELSCTIDEGIVPVSLFWKSITTLSIESCAREEGIDCDRALLFRFKVVSPASMEREEGIGPVS